MSQYIFILVWIAAMFFLKSVMSGGYRVENILGKKEYRVSWGFAAFAFCPVVIMATFRGDIFMREAIIMDVKLLFVLP